MGMGDEGRYLFKRSITDLVAWNPLPDIIKVFQP